MRLWRVVEDWWKHQGPEFWNPDDDEDVAYLREHTRQAQIATVHLQHRLDIADALRESRRNLSVPIKNASTAGKSELGAISITVR